MSDTGRSSKKGKPELAEITDLPPTCASCGQWRHEWMTFQRWKTEWMNEFSKILNPIYEPDKIRFDSRKQMRRKRTRSLV
jgi:hypothetical protein